MKMSSVNIICLYVKGCIKFNRLGISSIKLDCHDDYNITIYHLCRITNYCVMYRTQHNDGREGDQEGERGGEERRRGINRGSK